MFLEKYEGYLQEIRRAIENRDWLRLEKAAHTLLGSSVYFTTRNRLAALEQLEVRARERDPAGVEELSLEVEQVTKRLAEELRRVSTTGA